MRAINGRVHVAIQKILPEVLAHFPNSSRMFPVGSLFRRKHTPQPPLRPEDRAVELRGGVGGCALGFIFPAEKPAHCSQLNHLQSLCPPDALTSTQIKGTFASGKLVSWVNTKPGKAHWKPSSNTSDIRSSWKVTPGAQRLRGKRGEAHFEEISTNGITWVW